MQNLTQNADCTPNLVDARGLACPMPLLKAKQALSKLEAGDQLCVLATDPGSVKDIQRFVELSTHELLQFRQHDDHYEFILRRGAPQAP